MILDLRQIARVLGGEVSGKQALCPGPGHSPRDRSLSITLSSTAPDGFALFSHCDDDWRDCRDYVKRKLGLPLGPLPRETRPTAAAREPVRGQDDRAQGATTTADAMALWRASVDGRSTLVARYLNVERKLDLDPYLAVTVLRWHPGAGAMLASFRNILTGAPQAVERTFLDQNAKKIGRKFLGPAKGTAAMLDSFDSAGESLHVGAGVETCMTAQQHPQMRFRPTWALGSDSAITSFPVLSGIEAITFIQENDASSIRACEACAGVWDAARREVFIAVPKTGYSDINDVIRGKVAS
jgi:putative DNA primase/helicase